MHLAGDTYEQMRATFRWDIPARLNLADAICLRHAARDPTAPALLHEHTDGTLDIWSFARLADAARRLANALAALGIGSGDVVAIQLPQRPESPITHIAVQMLGAIALPMFNLFGPDAVAYRLGDSAAKALVAESATLERHGRALAEAAGLRHVIAVGGTAPDCGPAIAGHAFDTLLARASATRDPADTGSDDPALLMYTSGTTGNPKGVLHAARVVIGHLPGVMLPHELFPRPGDRIWTPADWAWAGGLLDVLLPALYCAVPVVGSARAKFDPEWAFAFMARHGVRNVFMPPTALRLMEAVPDPRERHAYSLRSLGTGGERLGAELIEWGRSTFGLTINEFYGQTEANLVVGNCSTLYPVREGSMGRALPGHDVEVVDDAGNILPPDQSGVVAVRCPDPVMFLSYWNRPEATAEKFRGEWCLLGDVATKDADGYFWFEGRDDDIINSAGYRIGPGEVEECLLRHPAVRLAGVVGTPDSTRGESVTAFVVLADVCEGTPELAAELQAFVRARLAAHEYPRKVHFIAEMPMTITGKIRRVDLRTLDSDQSQQGPGQDKLAPSRT